MKLIDNSVKESILRFPTIELIRKLFPDVSLRGRSVVCNPLRGEKHASLSCFRDRSGYQRWKDHATGETGDNIEFFRKVYPELGYVEAVDRLAFLVLGRSALQDVPAGTTISYDKPLPHRAPLHHAPVELPSALRIDSVLPFGLESGTPAHLVEYTRGRGVSDQVAGKYFLYVRFVNTNKVGRAVIDQTSGLPVLDKDGEIVREDGVNDAVAMRNDIGGFSLRVPDNGVSGGFKGADKAFPSFILADGSSAASLVHPFGKGELVVSSFRYDEASRSIFLGDGYGLRGVEPWAARFACVFLSSWKGHVLEGRDLSGVVAVLNAMNGPVNRVVSVVEGMFDAASVIELERLAGRGLAPGRDLVVLNSLSNLKWVVPFLSMHGEVRSLLDNDMRSSAGEKAYVVLKESVDDFARRAGVGTIVKSSSALFYPFKDMNDYLRHVKGFELNEKSTVSAGAAKSRKAGKGRSI